MNVSRPSLVRVFSGAAETAKTGDSSRNRRDATGTMLLVFTHTSFTGVA
jgi:hypothetical protein